MRASIVLVILASVVLVAPFAGAEIFSGPGFMYVSKFDANDEYDPGWVADLWNEYTGYTEPIAISLGGSAWDPGHISGEWDHSSMLSYPSEIDQQTPMTAPYINPGFPAGWYDVNNTPIPGLVYPGAYIRAVDAANIHKPSADYWDDIKASFPGVTDPQHFEDQSLALVLARKLAQTKGFEGGGTHTTQGIIFFEGAEYDRAGAIITPVQLDRDGDKLFGVNSGSATAGWSTAQRAAGFELVGELDDPNNKFDFDSAGSVSVFPAPEVLVEYWNDAHGSVLFPEDAPAASTTLFDDPWVDWSASPPNQFGGREGGRKAVPEPATVMLLVSGVLLVFSRRNKRRICFS